MSGRRAPFGTASPFDIFGKLPGSQVAFDPQGSRDDERILRRQ